MFDEWAPAALTSLGFCLSRGRWRAARIWLCRQRIADRIWSRSPASGIRSLLAQSAATVALTGRLSPRATVALILFASAAGASSAVAASAAGRKRDSILLAGISVEPP